MTKTSTSTTSALDELAREIRKELGAVATAFKKGLDHALTTGELLNKAFKQCQADGFKWAVWLKRHCKISESMAGYYRKLADNLATVEAKRKEVPDLTIRAALSLIKPAKAKTNKAPWIKVYESAVVVEAMTAEGFAEADLPRLVALLGRLGVKVVQAEAQLAA